MGFQTDILNPDIYLIYIKWNISIYISQQSWELFINRKALYWIIFDIDNS